MPDTSLSPHQQELLASIHSARLRSFLVIPEPVIDLFSPAKHSFCLVTDCDKKAGDLPVWCYVPLVKGLTFADAETRMRRANAHLIPELQQWN